MEDTELKNAYTEVNQVLNILGNKYKSKVPDKIIELLEKNQNLDYKTNISKKTKIEDIKISRTALIIISILNLKYWASSEEKEILKNIYDKNEAEYQKKINIYKQDDWLKKNKKEVEKEYHREVSMIEKKDISIISRIRKFFYNLFHKRK